MSERKRLRSFLESGSSESVHKNSSDSMGSSRRSSRANKGVKTTTNDIMEMDVRRAIKKQAVTKLSCSNPGKKAKRVVAKTSAKAHTNTTNQTPCRRVSGIQLTFPVKMRGIASSLHHLSHTRHIPWHRRIARDVVLGVVIERIQVLRVYVDGIPGGHDAHDCA